MRKYLDHWGDTWTEVSPDQFQSSNPADDPTMSFRALENYVGFPPLTEIKDEIKYEISDREVWRGYAIEALRSGRACPPALADELLAAEKGRFDS